MSRRTWLGPLLLFFFLLPLTPRVARANLPSTAECPLMPWEDPNPEIFVQVGKTRTYFCCDRCRRDWLQPDRGQTSGEKGAWMGALGRLHPLSVHFPIAFFCLAALAELLFLFTGRIFFRDGARFNVIFGALSAPVAALLGWCSGGAAVFPGDLADILILHLRLGITTAFLAIFTGFLSERSPERDDPKRVRAYRIALVITLVLVMATGFLGGKLVYGPDHYSL